jgi:hypothetical protein
VTWHCSGYVPVQHVPLQSRQTESNVWILFQCRKVPLIKVSWLIWSRSSGKESYTASSHLFRFLVFPILHSVVNVTDSILQRICGAQIQGNEGYQRMIFYLFRSHHSQKNQGVLAKENTPVGQSPGSKHEIVDSCWTLGRGSRPAVEDQGRDTWQLKRKGLGARWWGAGTNLAMFLRPRTPFRAPPDES